MELTLKGKVALVTGTASQIGMGKAIALTLAREGCDIIANDIDLAGAEKTGAEIKALGSKVLVYKADITRSSEVNDMVKAGIKELGRIDILVNNAGGGDRGGILSMDEAKRDRCIDLNLKGAMNCTKAVLPDMISRKWGRIVSTASHAAIMGHPSGFAYAASKAGIIGFTKSIALEMGQHGITVNAIIPGMVLTNLTIKDMTPERIEATRERLPLRRICTVQDAANMVLFLVSDLASYVTGQAVFVDGGALMR